MADGPGLRSDLGAGVGGALIATATGFGWARGAGRGWKTSRGASRHFITGAGRLCAAVGDGCRGRWWCVLYTRRRWWDLSAVEAGSELRWDLAADSRASRGFRWGRAIFTFLGITPARATCRTLISPTHVS